MLDSVAHTNSNFNDTLETKPRRKGGRPKKAPIAQIFDGFPINVSEGAFCCVPTCFFDLCAAIDNLAELKIVQYIMRHTWGFKEYNAPKRITVDEFMHGRKRADGTRMDCGTGLSKSAVLDGLERALKHGFIECFIDDRDRARVKHYYRLKIRNDGPTEPEPPTSTYFEDEAYPGQMEPDRPNCEEAIEETTKMEPEQEDYSQDYDPYANTIFAQLPTTPKSSEQKIFVSENEPITTHQEGLWQGFVPRTAILARRTAFT